VSIVAIIILVRIIWWVIRSQSAAPRVRFEEAGPVENHVPRRPQLGGYGIADPEEHDAR
jgi:hypothetical protein